MFDNFSTIISYKELCFSDFPEDFFEHLSVEKKDIVKERINCCSIYEIMYLSDGLKIKGFIVQPKHLKEKSPVIIRNRGGNKDFGMINLSNIAFSFCLLAKEGYIVIGSQLRGSIGSEGKDEFGGTDLNDILNLKLIIDDHPYADNIRIGMYGASRGGMMTYLALKEVDWIKSVVIKCGTANLIRNVKLRPEMQKVYNECFGGSEEDKIKRSVIFRPDKLPKNVPILLMHGTADWRVSPFDSIEMGKLLYENKIPYRLIMREGGDHSISEHKYLVNTHMLDFFKSYLVDSRNIDLEHHGN